MKDLIPLIGSILKLITPDPEKKGIRLEKAQLRLEKKKLRVAKRMLKQIEKEFKKDGFTDKETATLEELRNAIRQRRMELITG